MNFSLEINRSESLDVISFFSVEHAVTFPSEIWFQVLCASLRSKHEVLILETPVTALPVWDKKKRWQTEGNWCWLAPRSLSVISSAYKSKPFEFHEFKAFLAKSK